MSKPVTGSARHVDLRSGRRGWVVREIQELILQAGLASWRSAREPRPPVRGQLTGSNRFEFSKTVGGVGSEHLLSRHLGVTGRGLGRLRDSHTRMRARGGINQRMPTRRLPIGVVLERSWLLVEVCALGVDGPDFR